MKLRSFSATNFRAFAGEHSFPISDRFTVIAGVNGRGKTSLLDGAALLLSRLLRSLGIGSSGPRTISSTDVSLGTSDASLSMNVNCAGVPLDFSTAFRSESRYVRSTRLPDSVKLQIVRNYRDESRADDQEPLAIYYTTDRAGQRVPRTLPSTLARGRHLAHVGALSNRLVDYRDFMARYRVWRKQRRSREVAALEHAVGVFLKGFSDVQVRTRPLRLTVTKGSTRLSIDQLSDGERSFFAIVGDMVRRLALANPDLDDPLRGYGVVLIDELELHLHPTWQRSIVENLRETFPNIQFIGTTHSPFVIQSLRPGELINLDPDEFGEYSDKSIEDIAEHVMGIEIPQKSDRYLQMMGAATEYFALLRRRDARPEDVERTANRLSELSAFFSDDPAFHALLKLEREAQGHGGSSATNR